MRIITKKVFLFILILLFITSFSQNSYSKIKKNANIKKAKLLIKEKKYSEALEILAAELIVNEDQEDEIMKLINYIDKQITYQQDTIDTALEHLKEGDSKKAQEVLSKLDKDAKYNNAVNATIKDLEKEKKLIAQIQDFNLYIKSAEKDLVGFYFDSALIKYKNAMDIYRINKPINNDRIFTDAYQKLNVIEKRMYKYGFYKKQDTFDANSITKDNIYSQYKKFQPFLVIWKQREVELLSIQEKIFNVSDVTKPRIQYKAYKSIVQKFIFLIRRNIQAYSRDIEEMSYLYLQKLVSAVERGKEKYVSDIEEMLALTEELKITSNYRILLDFKDSNYLLRSQDNVIEYFNNFNKSNLLTLKYKFAIYNNKFLKIKQLENNFKSLKKEKNIIKAEQNIFDALKLNKEFEKEKPNIKALFDPYLDFRIYNDFGPIIDKYETMLEKSTKLAKTIENESQDFEALAYKVKRLIAEGNDLFKNGETTFKKKKYKNSKSYFKEAKDKYLEASMIAKSDNLNEKLKKILDYENKIEDALFKIEIDQAEKFLDQAKSYYYTQDYENAKTNLDQADNIYSKYNQKNDEIAYYRELILSAIKIQSGKNLSVYDPLYDDIIELLSNAQIAYNEKKYKLALNYISQILNEKPYNEKARKFETKILKETDPENFIKRFNLYYKKALMFYKSKKYTNALSEFQQLLEYNTKINEIKKYIVKCKSALGLIKTKVSLQDKKYAIKLVSEGQKDYSNGNFKSAKDKASKALIVWDKVPGAKQLLYSSIVQLREPLPKLSVANQKLFKEAENAYARADYATSYKLTTQILNSQPNFQNVVNLQKKSKIKMQQ